MKENGVPERAPQASGQDFIVNRRDFFGLAAASAVAASLGLDALLEPGWLEVTNTKVATPSIPSDHKGIRLALIADLHINDDVGFISWKHLNRRLSETLWWKPWLTKSRNIWKWIKARRI